MSAPRSGPLVGILLAAGSSSRFGSDKRLHPLLDGTPMAIACARHLRAVCDRVLAVVSPGSEALVSLLAAEGVEVLVSEASAQGMGHSLADGVRAAPQAGGWIVALADMPFIALTSYARIAAALRAGASLAAPVRNGKRGHPVGFASTWYTDLAALTGDAGARAILATAGEALVQCEVDDDGVLRDVDTPAAL